MRPRAARPGAALGAVAIAAALSAFLPAAAAVDPHGTAIVDARAGRYERALPVLERLVREQPGNAVYRHDLIAVLSWADRHVQALAASRQLKLDKDTPDYVLAAIGHSALHGQQPARAVQAYRLLTSRKPADADAALGHALALLDTRQAPQSDKQLQRVLKLGARKPALLRSAHEALSVRAESERARPFAQRLAALGQAPAAPQAVQPGQATQAATVQAPNAPPEPPRAPQAAAVAEAIPTPAPAPSPDFEALLQAHAGRVRAASALLERDYTPARYRLVDETMAENARLSAQAEAAGRPDLVKRLRQDRVQALRDRGDMAAAVAEFRALDAGTEPVAPYVLLAAADALLALRQPEEARTLYKRALAEAAEVNAHGGLLYAELEAEDFAGLAQGLDHWLAQSRQSLAARRAQATMLRFANRLDEAQASLSALMREQPTDSGLWLEQGELLAQRGQPRAAQARFERVLTAEPGHLRARIGLANAQWAQGDIEAAATTIASLRAEAPEHPAVQRLLREWEQRSKSTLSSGITRGFGQGLVAGNSELLWESSYQSGQSAQGLRAFANHHLARARFGGTEAQHERLSAGLEWTRRDLQLTAELGQDLRNAKDTVWAAALGWQQDDHWSWRLRHESQTNDFPLKARQPDSQAGAPTYLHASRTVLGGAWRQDEQRRVAADASFYDFNDGNRRQALALSWQERLHSSHSRTLDLTLAGYTSSNTLPDTVYFNPKRDLAVSATLAADWLTWRRYERSFNQRLSLTVGNYRQTSEVRLGTAFVERSFGWRPFQELRYEHEWQWAPSGNLRYGIGSRRFAYDGVYESKLHAYLNALWRF
ncbi:poly-beta-1,6 N-acetyl-D-glucosamine export porin PgaA [Roseateles microcysteis]|uniref:poly-beta-1,6 N-acetyl-D-glucosamine export porin PgaA n=1 Tax=Roseateles microcysteis TaxID=3119057 RepID=UPI002FE5596F